MLSQTRCRAYKDKFYDQTLMCLESSERNRNFPTNSRGICLRNCFLSTAIAFVSLHTFIIWTLWALYSFLWIESSEWNVIYRSLCEQYHRQYCSAINTTEQPEMRSYESRI